MASSATSPTKPTSSQDPSAEDDRPALELGSHITASFVTREVKDLSRLGGVYSLCRLRCAGSSAPFLLSACGVPRARSYSSGWTDMAAHLSTRLTHMDMPFVFRVRECGIIFTDWRWKLRLRVVARGHRTLLTSSSCPPASGCLMFQPLLARHFDPRSGRQRRKTYGDPCGVAQR